MFYIVKCINIFSFRNKALYFRVVGVHPIYQRFQDFSNNSIVFWTHLIWLILQKSEEDFMDLVLPQVFSCVRCRAYELMNYGNNQFQQPCLFAPADGLLILTQVIWKIKYIFHEWSLSCFLSSRMRKLAQEIKKLQDVIRHLLIWIKNKNRLQVLFHRFRSCTVKRNQLIIL